MNSPLLSICIPTYNRALYLKELLDSIVCQFDDVEIYNKVEIIISDNASDDNTREIAVDYQKKYKNIRYFRNKENIGPIKNILKCLSMSIKQMLLTEDRGYSWLIGDDDMIYPNSLKYILDKINSNYYSVVLMNYDVGEHNNPKIKSDRNFLRIKEDKEYFDFKNFFMGDDFKNFYGINFISVLAFKKNLLKENFNKLCEFLDTLYLHSYAFLILGASGNILRIGSPMVVCRYFAKERRYDQWVINEKKLLVILTNMLNTQGA